MYHSTDYYIIEFRGGKLYVTLKFYHEHDPEIATFIKETLSKHVNVEVTTQLFDSICKSVDEFMPKIKGSVELKLKPGWAPIKVSPKNNLSHNETLYRSIVEAFGVTNDHDIKFICNHLGKAYSKFCCIDNYRICYSGSNKRTTAEYDSAVSNGCCGFYDRLLYNEYTDNYFMVGFNHGH